MASPSSLLPVEVKVPHLHPIFMGTVKVRIVDFTLGPKYYTASPGIPLPANVLGFSDVYAVQIQNKNAVALAFVFQYDYVNKCIRAYRQSAATSALTEVADSDTAFLGTEQIRVMAFGVG